MKKKENIYSEYFINGTYLKKIYNLYLHKSFFDKLLNFLILMALIIIIVSLVLEYLMPLNHKIMLIIESSSAFIIFIFSIEIFRDYLKSKTTKEFFKEHWIDLLLIIFFSIYFIFVSFLGFLKILKLEFVKNIVLRFKHFRVLYSNIKKKIKKIKMKVFINKQNQK